MIQIAVLGLYESFCCCDGLQFRNQPEADIIILGGDKLSQAPLPSPSLLLEHSHWCCNSR